MTEAQILILSYAGVFLSAAIFAYIGFQTMSQQYRQYTDRMVADAAVSLEDMFVAMPPRVLFNLQFLSIPIVTFILFILTGSIGLSLVLGVPSFFLPKIVIQNMQKRRNRKIEDQLESTIEALVNTMKAGYSLVQALQYIVKELPRPISLEFSLVLRENRLGITLDEALTNMASRINSKELDILVNSVIICRQLGGNVTEVLDKIAGTIRERHRLEGQIKTQTAQARMQGYLVGLMPLGLGVIMYTLDPASMTQMFTRPIGMILLIVMVVMITVGLFVIQRLVNIDI